MRKLVQKGKEIMVVLLSTETIQISWESQKGYMTQNYKDKRRSKMSDYNSSGTGLEWQSSFLKWHYSLVNVAGNNHEICNQRKEKRQQEAMKWCRAQQMHTGQAGSSLPTPQRKMCACPTYLWPPKMLPASYRRYFNKALRFLERGLTLYRYACYIGIQI